MKVLQIGRIGKRSAWIAFHRVNLNSGHFGSYRLSLSLPPLNKLEDLIILGLVEVLLC